MEKDKKTKKQKKNKKLNESLCGPRESNPDGYRTNAYAVQRYTVHHIRSLHFDG
jgi:hypothetical protein